MPRARAIPASLDALFAEESPTILSIELAQRSGLAILALSTGKPRRVSRVALRLSGLEVGSRLDPKAALALVEAEDVAKIVRQGMRLLAAAPKTRAELERRLLEKGHEPGDVRRALEYLASNGLLDERAVAERIARKSRGSRALLRDALERRGVEAREVERSLRRAAPDDAAAVDVARVLCRKMPATLSPIARQKRLLSSLARRGFTAEESVDAARRVLPRFIEEEDSTL